MGFFDRIFGRRAPDGPAGYHGLVEQATAELRLKTAAHDGLWRLGEADWAVDQDAGTLVFTRPDGMVATCAVQIVGTYNPADGTWLWGWDHPAVVPALQAHARQVRAYGEKHGIERLTTRKLACTEAEAWELTAVACKLCGAQGAYRGPADGPLVFMTYGEVTLGAGPAGAPRPAKEADEDAEEVDPREIGAEILSLLGEPGGKVLLYAEVEPYDDDVEEGFSTADLLFVAQPDGKTVRPLAASEELRELVHGFWETGHGEVAARSWAAMEYVVNDGAFTITLVYPDQLGAGRVSDRRSRAVAAHFPGAAVDFQGAIRALIRAAAGAPHGKVLLYAEAEDFSWSAGLFVASPDGKTVRYRNAPEALSVLVYRFWETGDATVADRSWRVMEYVLDRGGFSVSFTPPDQVDPDEMELYRRQRALAAHFPGVEIHESRPGG